MNTLNELTKRIKSIEKILGIEYDTNKEGEMHKIKKDSMLESIEKIDTTEPIK